MKALITAASTAHAYKLQHLLDQELHFIYADQVDMPQLTEKKFVKIPAGNAPSFAHELLSLCLDKQIDLVYPLKKDDILALSEARQLFEEYHIRVLVPSTQIVRNLLTVAIKKGIIFVVLEKEFIVKPDIPDINSRQFENGVYIADPHNNMQYTIYTAG